LKKAFDARKLQFFGDLEPLREPAAFASYLNKAKAMTWDVYVKRPLTGPKQVLDYISRRTHSVAIANDRLVNMDDGQVTFKFKDYGDGGKVKTYSLEATEFLRRFILLHVVPEGFHTIRYGGFLGNKVRDEKLAQCRRLLGMVTPHDGAKATMPQKGSYDRYFPGDSLYKCPRCRDGVMVITELLPKVIVAYEGSINSS
jgi:hypothetical protein